MRLGLQAGARLAMDPGTGFAKLPLTSFTTDSPLSIHMHGQFLSRFQRPAAIRRITAGHRLCATPGRMLRLISLRIYACVRRRRRHAYGQAVAIER